MVKSTVCGIIGLVGGVVAAFFGGWDAGMITLVTFMCIDYISGIIVAGVFKKSKKSKKGALSSRVGWMGLCRKFMTLLIVGVAFRLDLLTNSDYIRDAVVIGFSANEFLSIIENAGLMGLPLPQALLDAVEILKHKENEHDS